MSIKISEKHLEDILFEAIQSDVECGKLSEKGLDIYYDDNCLYYRQLNLKEYGIPDIIRIRVQPNYFIIDIIELKVTEFDISHLLQLGRYMSAAHHILQRRKKKRYISVNGFLIVSEFNMNNDYTWLDRTINENVEVYSTEYTINGLEFTKQLPSEWRLNNTVTGAKNYVNTADIKNVYKEALHLEYLQNQYLKSKHLDIMHPIGEPPF